MDSSEFNHNFLYQFLPQNGLSRELLLGFEVIIAVICIQFFILFLTRYSNQKTKSKMIHETNLKFPLSSGTMSTPKGFQEYLNIMQGREFLWCMIYFLLGLVKILQIIGDFYIILPEDREIFVFSADLSIVFVFILISFLLERYELKENHFLLTKIFAGILIILMISLIFFSDFSILITFCAIPPIYVLLFQYIRETYRKSLGFHHLLFIYFGLSLGLFLFTSGYLFTTSPFLSWLGWVSRLVGDVIQLIGLVLLAWSFYIVPVLDEYEWLDKIRAIYIIHPHGICLYHHQFRIAENQESDLSTSAIYTINEMVQQMSPKKRQKSISFLKDNFTILIKSGESVLSVIIADSDSIFLREKNSAFCKEFESQFSKEINYWNGNVSIFRNADQITEIIFDITSLGKQNK
ncbi:MAG: hypothetical protein ACTSVU_08635 [Promethearchaeota archaeon]